MKVHASLRIIEFWLSQNLPHESWWYFWWSCEAHRAPVRADKNILLWLWLINRLNPQTRQLIRLWHNLIRALHFDFRENKNINIYISPGWRQTYCIKYDPSLSTSCVLSSSQKLPIMTLFTILLLLLIDEKGSYTLLFLLSWSRLITNSQQCSRLGLLNNHCFSFIMITQTLLFNWIIQIVPYQSLLANVKNIRELSSDWDWDWGWGWESSPRRWQYNARGHPPPPPPLTFNHEGH